MNVLSVVVLYMAYGWIYLFFFFKDTETTEIYTYGHTLSLHDALPIYLSRADIDAEQRPQRRERSRRAVPAPRGACRRAGAAARAVALSVHRAAPRALWRPHSGRTARGDRRGGRVALLGRGRGQILWHEFSGSRPVQRRPRQPVHRRPDAQASGLCRDAARNRAQRHRRPAPQRTRGDADAGE